MIIWRIRRVRRPRRKLAETEETEAQCAAAKAAWDALTSKGNINLNLNLMRLPEHLRDYVMLHELCHLRHLDHGPAFQALLASLCPDHRECRRALREYKLI